MYFLQQLKNILIYTIVITGYIWWLGGVSVDFCFKIALLPALFLAMLNEIVQELRKLNKR